MHIYEDSSMGKRRPTWDYQHYLRYLKEGRGQGTGADYKPWIYIHDFPSRGISARIPGRTTGRIHHASITCCPETRNTFSLSLTQIRKYWIYGNSSLSASLRQWSSPEG